jgi:hypothetical protein
MKQPSLFPTPPPPVYRTCVHGVSITWTPRECPQCDADPGDEPKGK